MTENAIMKRGFNRLANLLRADLVIYISVAETSIVRQDRHIARSSNGMEYHMSITRSEVFCAAGSSNGRTTVFGAVYEGSSPSPTANSAEHLFGVGSRHGMATARGRRPYEHFGQQNP